MEKKLIFHFVFPLVSSKTDSSIQHYLSYFQEPSKETKIKAKKSKKNTEDGTGEEKKKKKSSKKKEEFDDEGAEKGKKVKKTKRKEEKSPRAALEDFLGGELEGGNDPEDKDYDPL